MSFNLEEVSRHKVPGDAWVALHGKVYDVSSWLDKHPGGARILLRQCGKDASEVFDKHHKQGTLELHASALVVGDLEFSAPTTEPPALPTTEPPTLPTTEPALAPSPKAVQEPASSTHSPVSKPIKPRPTSPPPPSIAHLRNPSLTSPALPPASASPPPPVTHFRNPSLTPSGPPPPSMAHLRNASLTTAPAHPTSPSSSSLSTSSSSLSSPPSSPSSANTAAVVAAPSASVPPEGMTPELKMRRMRDQITQEIVDTETTYVNSLETTISQYLIPLSSLASNPETCVLTKDQISTLFSNIATLHKLNEQFRLDLTERRKNQWTDNDCIGDLFVNFAPYFKMYTLYINNHEAATTLLGSLMKDAKYVAFASLLKGPALASLLIEPVQRVPRYKMLLEVVIKNTPPGHPDCDNLAKGLASVSIVATHINEHIRQRANRDRIREIESKLLGSPSLISPSRKFIREGTLTKQCRNKDVTYEFFLFNDVLAYASRIPMSPLLRLHRLLPINSAFQVAGDSANKKAFLLVSSKKSFKLYGSSVEEVAGWISDLADCMILAHKQVGAADDEAFRDTRAVWQQNKTSSHCPYCKIKFTVTKRRHHCRKCGNLACGDCSRTFVALVAGGSKERVCNHCAETHFGKVVDKSATLKKAAFVGASRNSEETVSFHKEPSEDEKEDVGDEDDDDDSEGLEADEKGPLPKGWLLYYTDDRTAYYANADKNLTVWERPDS